MRTGFIIFFKELYLYLLGGIFFFGGLGALCSYYKSQEFSAFFSLCMIIPLFFKQRLSNWLTREIIITLNKDSMQFTTKKEDCESGNLFLLELSQLKNYRISDYGFKYYNISFTLMSGKHRNYTFYRKQLTEAVDTGDKIIDDIHLLIKNYNVLNEKKIIFKPSFSGSLMGLIIISIFSGTFIIAMTSMFIKNENVIAKNSVQAPLLIICGLLQILGLWGYRYKALRQYRERCK